jgi:hypothetical protein
LKAERVIAAALQPHTEPALGVSEQGLKYKLCAENVVRDWCPKRAFSTVYFWIDKAE